MKCHRLKIVLHSPQIPPNTGCIARTCAATNTQLHLIKPINFSLSDKALKRAGIDYWDSVDLVIHDDFQKFNQYRQDIGGRLLGFSPAGKINYKGFEYKENDWIMHGTENSGIPVDVLTQCDHVLTIPMSNSKVRSLNLAVCAGISLYEGIFSVNN